MNRKKSVSCGIVVSPAGHVRWYDTTSAHDGTACDQLPNTLFSMSSRSAGAALTGTVAGAAAPLVEGAGPLTCPVCTWVRSVFTAAAAGPASFFLPVRRAGCSVCGFCGACISGVGANGLGGGAVVSGAAAGAACG